MMRTLLRSVIHNATVTRADPAMPVSVRLDPVLLRAAELMPLEQVEVINVATGERFTTFVEATPEEGTGEVRVHGGEKHHVRAGDVVSIVSWGALHDGQTLGHRARLVTVDGTNRVVALQES